MDGIRQQQLFAQRLGRAARALGVTEQSLAVQVASSEGSGAVMLDAIESALAAGLAPGDVLASIRS